jgi:Fic family protein
MDPSEFKAVKAGHVVTSPEGYDAFVPAPLPPRLTFTGELAVAVSRADAALGTLSGLAGELPSPAAMAAPFLRQEALCSTRIEGVDVGLTEVLLHEISAAPADSGLRQLDEVRNVLATLMYGVESVATRPLDLGLIRSLHERSLHGEPATARTPGKFRTTQNWIGPPGSTLATATYVPPPVPEMLAGLDQLEGFMAERDRLPDLVQCAMAHAQFESIHPFVGGNGRLGRVLILLFLVARGRLSLPLLYLSAYLEAHRREYYTLLQRVRTHGEWMPWLLFFAEGVRETAERAHLQARSLLRQRARYRSQCDEKLLALVDELFVSPFLTVREVRRALSVSDGTARRAVATLASLGLLARVPGTERPRIYVAQPILDAIEEPTEALVGGVDEAPGSEPLKSWLGWDRRPRRLADRLMTEAMAMIDVARHVGVDVRLAGGLAVRRHCIDLNFLDREYSDVDLVGLSGQREALCGVFSDLGYAENLYVSQATLGRQLQFFRKEALRSARPGGPEAPDDPETPHHVQAPARPLVDHVDVFLDVMRMDHDIEIRGRLELDEYAISPVDALIAKAQIGRINHKDVHDIIALFKDLPLREIDDDLSIYVPYLAEVCAGDWGLYHDITKNLQVVLDWLADYGLSEEETARVYGRVTAAVEAIEDEEKPRRWQRRARLGKRVAWRREVEGAKGTPVVAVPPD